MILEDTIWLIDKKKEDLGIEMDDVPTKFAYLASQVESIRPCGLGDEGCIIYFKSGSNIQVKTEYDDLLIKLGWK